LCSQCSTLRVQFVASQWPTLVYKTRRVRSDASLFSGHTRRGTTCRFPPPHLKLYEIIGRGESGQVLNGTVSVPQSKFKQNVVAKLFLHAHLNKFHNEIHLYRTRLAKLRNIAIPKVFGAFVIQDSNAAAKTMETWGIIVMERCGSAAQSPDELTVDQRYGYMCHSLILVPDDYDQEGRLPMPSPYSSGRSSTLRLSSKQHTCCFRRSSCDWLLRGSRAWLPMPWLLRVECDKDVFETTT